MKNSTQQEKDKLMYTDSFGDTFEVFPKINFYLDNNNLYLGLDSYDEDLEAIDAYCDITVNIDVLPYLHSAVDLTYGGEGKIKFLEDNGFGHRTGQALRSGFGVYPIFAFNEDKLCQIDPETFAAYAKAHGKDKPSLDSKIGEAQKKTEAVNSQVEQKEPER